MDFILSGHTKMHEIVEIDNRSILFFSRFGLQPGYQDKTLREVCLENHLDVDFLVLMANVFMNPEYFPDHKLQKLDIDLLLLYLNNSHQYYLEEVLPSLDRLMADFVAKMKHPVVNQLDKFYKQYVVEVKEHLAYEDETAFPYVAKLSDFLKNNTSSESFGFDYSIHDFDERHDNIEEKLSDLKNLLIKYLPPNNDIYLRARLIKELMDFEVDLIKHARIEDKVLIPIVAQFEQYIR